MFAPEKINENGRVEDGVDIAAAEALGISHEDAYFLFYAGFTTTVAMPDITPTQAAAAIRGLAQKY